MQEVKVLKIVTKHVKYPYHHMETVAVNMQICQRKLTGLTTQNLVRVY